MSEWVKETSNIHILGCKLVCTMCVCVCVCERVYVSVMCDVSVGEMCT